MPHFSTYNEGRCVKRKIEWLKEDLGTCPNDYDYNIQSQLEIHRQKII